MELSITGLKIILICVMFTLTITFATLPIILYRFLDRKQQSMMIKNGKPKEWPTIILSMLTCFSGGIFISLCFLDILNESIEAFNTLKAQNIWVINYPLVQLICLLSFFLIYTVDEISCKSFTHIHGQRYGNGHEHSHEHIHNVEAADDVNANGEIPTDQNNNATNKLENNINEAKNSVIPKTVEERRNIVKSMNFLLAIIFHSVFDGIALGVQNSDFTLVTLFFGLGVHKSIEAFSTGLRIIRAHKDRPYFSFVLIIPYAITSPIFAILGMVITDLSTNEIVRNKMFTILMSMSMGTFLYIAFFEMLAPEREDKKYPIFKLVATFLGFTVIAIIMIWSE